MEKKIKDFFREKREYPRSGNVKFNKNGRYWGTYGMKRNQAGHMNADKEARKGREGGEKRQG